MARKGPPIGDGWFESEQPTRTGMIAELQRMKLRLKVRPVPVLLLALVMTAAVTYKVVKKPHTYEARVVLAISEGLMTRDSLKSIPFDELQQYVSAVLLPESRILEMIKKRNPRSIDRLGPQAAVEDFRENFDIEIWKNSFVYFNWEEMNANKSARIGIEVYDLDPDNAYEIAQELASTIIASHEENRQRVAIELSEEVTMMREKMEERLAELSADVAGKKGALDDARRLGKNQLAARLLVEYAAVQTQQTAALVQAKVIASSPDYNADRVTAAGLDVTIEVVDQRRPDRPEKSGFLLAMLIVVIATVAMILSTLLVGAFDSRVHDTDDVTRLGLPILGHVPGFPGDHVGSLEARGAVRARVPSFLRWRSQR